MQSAWRLARQSLSLSRCSVPIPIHRLAMHETNCKEGWFGQQEYGGAYQGEAQMTVEGALARTNHQLGTAHRGFAKYSIIVVLAVHLADSR